MGSRKEACIIIGYFVTLFLITICAVNFLSRLPIVHWSKSQNKCVNVYISGQKCDCSTFDLNGKYEKVWVE